jgi:hypothetical protein
MVGIFKWAAVSIGVFMVYVMILAASSNHLSSKLRAVECPSDIIDAVGGWTTKGIGHAYGKGYTVDILAKWMRKIEA